jgi:hypothetical protein
LMLVNLLGGKCEQCGSVENLEVDHRDRASKSHRVGGLIKGRLELLLAEAVKCQLLCDTCHNNKSREESGVEHGGGKSGKKNCPCEPCRTRKAEYMKTYVRPSRRSKLP